ncbi:chemotaxis protein CheA [Fulvivirgaceae bacterium BMA12]|uniref:Chemotaxis protein CheA n=1 Tax=Agaribacillus aureus TaxID=3051825 RepID=A0ABT8L7E1_9BACT|nr:chemotaxis protein CheA [Fulvivirgaceae bacterium BMA12]
MKSKDQEYKEIFLAEALENHEELNRLMTVLEKKPGDTKSVNAIFRITHTLKGNAAGMGFKNVADFAHVLEDLFGEVRDGKLSLDDDMFGSLFKAIDVLGALINAVKDDGKVSFRGIKTKLEVMLKSVQQEGQDKATAEKPLEEKLQQPAPKPKRGATSKGNKKAKVTPTRSSKRKPVSQGKAVIDKKSAEKTKNVPAESVAEKVDPGVENLDQVDDTKIAFSDLVQVPVRKLDNLLNLVGELVIERDRIISANSARINANEYARLNRISSDLQYSVMDVRLVQVGFLFNKFHRVVRDAASHEKKKVTLNLEGTETEIDRNILQIISDSLIHLIRNAIGHGVETPEERKKAGKPEEGSITLSAFSESDAVIIEIKDDGRGIDAAKVREKAIKQGLISTEDARHMADNDIILMIFEPGFSTMDQVTAISGRGVGMDVVKKALDSIGGNVSVRTEPGIGSTFSLRLPSSMAVKGTLLFELDKETYAIPLSYTEAVVSLYKPDIHKVSNGLIATYLGNTISVVFLSDLFALKAGESVYDKKVLHHSYDHLDPGEKLDIVIVSYNDRTIGFVVDKLLQQKEIVEKPLMKPIDQVKIISGVTIMGNGHVCLVFNVAAICNMVFAKSFSNKNAMSHH